VSSKIAIIGVGEVGAAAAYALLLNSVCRELLLVDINIGLRDGQIRDLSDASYFGNTQTNVRSGTYKEAGQCDIIVIAAESKRTIGETSVESSYHDISVLCSIVQAMKPIRSDAILLVVSNPVDVLTSFAQRLSLLPETQVIGCGTFLDTVRLRIMLAHKLGVPPRSIDAYVLGAHGHSQFVAWSTASVIGAHIDEAFPPNTFSRAQLTEQCAHETNHTVGTKPVVEFGIGSIVSSICSSILLDRLDICPISHFVPDLGCCVTLPVVIGRNGIVKRISLPLSSEESAKLKDSAKTLRETVERIWIDISI